MSDKSAPPLIERVERVLTPIYTALAVLAATAGAAIVVLIGTSVVMRHIAGAPFRFTEELVGLLMTAAFFLALPHVTLRAEHVRIRLFVSALPRAARRTVGWLAAVFGVLFCVWVVALAVPWFDFAFARGIKSEAARLLLWPWMALLPVSLALTATALAIRGISGEPMRTRET